MILVLDRRRDTSYPAVTAAQPRARLAFSPSSSADDVVNGGWWPRSRDPATELPALVDAVAERLGVVRRVALNADAWTSWPHELVIIGGPRVRLDWCAGDAHTIRLTGDDAWHLDLLAIPPDTPAILALTCLARAVRDRAAPKRTDAAAGTQPARIPDGRHLHALPPGSAPLRHSIQGGVDRRPVDKPTRIS
jgi:hypothetical protein